jgi:hypothetical protein
MDRRKIENEDASKRESGVDGIDLPWSQRLYTPPKEGPANA